MPRGFMDDHEGEVIGEAVHEGGLGKDIFSADMYSEDAFSTGEVPRPLIFVNFNKFYILYLLKFT